MARPPNEYDIRSTQIIKYSGEKKSINLLGTIINDYFFHSEQKRTKPTQLAQRVGKKT